MIVLYWLKEHLVKYIKLTDIDYVSSKTENLNRTTLIDTPIATIEAVPQTQAENMNIILTPHLDVEELIFIGQFKYIHIESKSKIKLDFTQAKVEVLSVKIKQEIIFSEHLTYYFIDHQIQTKGITLIGYNMIDIQNKKKISLNTIISNNIPIYDVNKITQADISPIESYIEKFL